MHPNMFDYYSTILPLALPPLCFGFRTQNPMMYNYTERIHSFHNRLPFLPFSLSSHLLRKENLMFHKLLPLYNNGFFNL
jgi:hypothetical protein